MKTINESQRSLPISGSYDVFVAGGGPAGVVAALAAARNGARTMLVDVAGCLGGTWTAGQLCWIIDAGNKGGIMAEIGEQLDRRDARRYRLPTGGNYAYDPEVMKLLLEELCCEAGVDLLYHTRVVAAQCDGRRLGHVITESKSGRQAWAVRSCIDCSGDGDLGHLAGCGFDKGHPETGRMQPFSMPILLTGLDSEEIDPFVGGCMAESKRRLYKACCDAGFEPSYNPCVMMRIHEDLYVMIPDHQYDADSCDAASVTRATINARREIDQLVKALRGSGGPWRNLRLVSTAAHIGIREGRRIHGRATIGIDDLLSGHHPEDSIATCRFGFDVHSTDGAKTKGFQHPDQKARPYGLPLRSLIARDVDGLLMAGRCVSGDFFAHSSYRVTGDAAVMGQAAGCCAALACAAGVLPHEVDGAAVRAQLRSDGVDVPEVSAGAAQPS